MNRINFYNFRQLWLGACCLLFAAGSLNATTCPQATVVSSLPYSAGVVCTGSNDITAANTNCSAISTLYYGGQEALLTYTPAASGPVEIAYSGQTWTSIVVFEGCPTDGSPCLDGIASSANNKSLVVFLQGGTQYYILIDTWPAPPSPCPGTVTITNTDIDGCTDPSALNYNPQATLDDGSCIAAPTCGGGVQETFCYGNNADVETYYAPASPDFEVTLYFFQGTVESATFDQLVIYDGDNTGAPILYQNPTGITQLDGLEVTSTQGNGILITLSTDGSVSCQSTASYNEWIYNVFCSTAGITGCTDPNAANYNPLATIDDGSCDGGGGPDPVPGCTDPTALNYNPNATVDNGSCQYDDPTALSFCADAIPVGCFQTYEGSTSGADVQSEAPDCGTSVTAPGVWHSYVGTGRNVEVNTCGSGFDTKLTVVTADCQTGAIECVAANDDACGLQSSVTFPAEFGQTYYILVHGFGTASGNYELNVVCGIPTTVLGCTDPSATNFNPLATQDDGSCEYDVDQPCLSTRLWPSATFTPTCSGSPQNITTGGWADEYSRVNVIAGTEYTFSSSVASDYITISDNSNNQSFVFGTGPQTWTATFTGVVRFHTHLDANCTGQNVSRTRSVACGATVVAPNADCSSAEPIACGDLIFGSTADGLVADLPNCGTSITSKGVWYTFQGTGSPVTVSTCGSSFDTKLSVFVGICGGEFVCAGGNDDACGAQSEVELRFTQLGATYYVLVHGFGSATGNFELSLECVVPGCTDPSAFNYNPDANVDDGSCAYPPNPVLGCTDPAADNYDPSATQNDGSCQYIGADCQTVFFENYCYGNNDNTLFTYTDAGGNPLTLSFISGTIEACCDDIIVYDGPDANSAVLFSGSNGGNLAGLMFTSSGSSISFQVDSDGSVSCQSGSRTTWEWAVFCAGESLGCTDPAATNYDADATIDDGSCTLPIACGTPIMESYCYGNNDNTLFTYTSANNASLTLGFISGTIEACCDDIIVYDGPDANSAVLFSGSNGGNLAGLMFTSSGSSISFQVDSDGSVSCQSGSRTTWEWAVGCSNQTLQAPTTQTAAPAQADRLRVFPNPATTELNVDLSAFIGAPATIFIHNSLGQTLQMRQIDEVQTTLERFDLNQLQAGMYFINVQVEGRGQFTERVIVNGNR